MGLATLPTQTDGSLGRPKQDLFAVPDLAHHVPASEWNELVERLVEADATIGLGDGSTAGSIEQALLALADPLVRQSTRFHWFEDFFELLTGRLTITGDVVVVGEDDAVVAAAGSGAGVVKVGGSANVSSFAFCVGQHYAGRSEVRLRTRTPTTKTANTDFGGFSNAALTHVWDILPGTAAGSWLCRAIDAGGNANVDNISGGAIPAYAAETWYTFRVKLLQTSIEYYVNDVLLHTATTHLPTASEKLCGWSGIGDIAAGNAIYIDAIDVRGTRR